jgi:ADP-ribose pyrophosphatase YjhB (NUDIX family)
MPNRDFLIELSCFVQRIAATARTGLAFKPDGYDAERYQELLHEAARITALLEDLDDMRAVELRDRWMKEVDSGFDGYVTTGVGCGVIAFNERDELLLLKRLTGKWWYPTGFCDVGLSPAEHVVKEAKEETGLDVTPLRLMAILDSRHQGSARRHLYSMLFYCRIDGGNLKASPLEALDVGFFPLERLPEPLSMPERTWVSLAREFHFEGRREAYFDPI